MIGVPDTAVRSIKLGQPVNLAIDAFSNRTFRAQISRFASAADARTRDFDVEVAVPNREHLLKPGMIAALQLATSGTAQSPSYQVPLSAIVQSPSGSYGVFVISGSSEGKIARLRNVDIGTVNGSDIAVLNGLGSGDEVITTGANLLKDGQRVEVLQ